LTPDQLYKSENITFYIYENPTIPHTYDDMENLPDTAGEEENATAYMAPILQ
jgi:hypothetical protein